MLSRLAPAILLTLTLTARAADLPATAPASAAPALPSMSDITDQFTAKQYPKTLAMIAQVLSLQGPAAAPYDHHQLLMLKAQCLIQTRDFPDALTVLAAAAKNTKKPEDAYEPTALAALLKKSPAGIYPHGPDKFNLLDPDQRKTAYQKFWADQLAGLQAEVKSDKADASIVPILDDVKALPISRALEFMATDATANTDKLAKQLEDRAVKLLDNNLKRMTTKVDDIAKQAATRVRVTDLGLGASATHRAGLTFAQIQTLKEIESTCSQIPAAVATLEQTFPTEQKTLTPIATKATALQNKSAKLRTTTF